MRISLRLIYSSIKLVKKIILFIWKINFLYAILVQTNQNALSSSSENYY